MMLKNYRFFFLIITIIIVSLACNFSGTAASPTSVTQVSQPTVDPQQILNQAVKVDPNSNSVTMTLTEAQVNSLILSQIQKFQPSSQLSISQPAVKLQNGLIILNGKVAAGLLSVDVMISLKPSVTSDHKILLVVEKSDFGPLPVPQDFAKQIADLLTTSVNQTINESGDNLQIDSVTISDGIMVVVAHH